MADQKQTVKFGDICREVKLTSKDPLADGYDKYIGLEHLDSGSLKIKRWGSIAEEKPSFTRVFKKGHILFGKRRPYLKKAAIAEFDGICSGDIVVMEPKGKLMLPELVPFVIRSQKFWDWAIKTSSGSLSPRTKFSSLSLLEFSIPNQLRQEQILALFLQNQKVCDRKSELEHSCITLFEALSKEKLSVIPQNFNGKLPSKWQVKNLNEIALVERGKFTPRPRNNPIYYGGSIPFIQTGDVGKARLFITSHEQTINEAGLAVSKMFDKGTIFITIAANIGDVAIATYDVACTDSVVGIQPKSGVDGLWLLFYLNSLKSYLDGISTESAQKNINLATLRPLKLAVPPYEKQVEISKCLLQAYKVIEELKENSTITDSLLREVF